MAQTTFKTFGPYQFNNLIVKGLLEYKLQPWEMVVEVLTKITPSDKIRDQFKSIGAFRKWMVDNHVGQAALIRELNQTLPTDWDASMWSGFGYSYDHSPRQFKYGYKSDFNLTLHLDTPELESWTNLRPGFEAVAKSISSLPNFTTNNLVKFQAA